MLGIAIGLALLLAITLACGICDRSELTLESAGVIFVEENGEGPGVRLRKGMSTE